MRKNWRGSSAWAQGQGVVSTSFPIHVRPMAQSRHLDAACGSHRFASLHWIRPCPFSETVRAWPVCGQEGAILQWGMSNPDVAGTEDSLSLPQGKDFAVAQALYDSEERVIGYGLVPWCSRRGIPVMAYVPMGDRRFGNMRLCVKFHWQVVVIRFDVRCRKAIGFAENAMLMAFLFRGACQYVMI